MRRWTLFLLVLVIYAVGFFGGYIQDDRRVIVSDGSIGTWQGLLSSLAEPYYRESPSSGAYRPLTSVSFHLNGLLIGKSPWSFRAVNIILYGLLCVGVYELLKRLGVEKRAFSIALVFAVLPIHTEAVNNIVGRGELMVAGFVVLAMILALDRKWEGSIASLLGAMMSKETGLLWLVPLGLLLVKSDETKDKKWGLIAILTIILTGYFMIRLGVLGTGIFSDNATIVENPLKFLPVGERVMTAIGLIAFGVSKVLFPLNLSYDYSFNQIHIMDLGSGFFWAGVFIVMLSAWLAVYKRRDLLVVWGLAFFWLPMMVTGNIIKPIGTIFGERLWLMPSLGVLLLVAWAMGKISIKRGEWLIFILVIIFGARTFLRNIDWLSEKNLFFADGRYATGSVLAQSNMAAVLLMDNRLDEAKLALDRADKIYPTYPELMNNWGMYYWGKMDYGEAKSRFEYCLEVHPGNILCLGNLENLEVR